MRASIVIRTLNEAKYLDELLSMISAQQTQDLDIETVLIDSGSTDGTIEIAETHGCRITSIDKKDFSFGRSLNRGCAFSTGDILVFISGHCVPVDEHWLQRLCQPLIDGVAHYSYGGQLGGPDTHYAETRIFAKYFPKASRIPQDGFFCNNANSALLRSSWDVDQFDEELTGLEDMELAKRLVAKGQRVAYVAEAPVYHYHDETWPGVRHRFAREAIALQNIMPEVQVSRLDMLRYIASSVWGDCLNARREGRPLGEWKDILLYRYNQYVGTYHGNHEHRLLSRERKEQFFYPTIQESDKR